MKPYLLFLLLFFYSASYGQWQWSNPKPSGYVNNSVVFSDAQNGFIINSNGDLLHTADQGNSWHIQQNLPSANTIDYKDSTLVAGGFALVYVSTDMGQNWVKRTITQPEQAGKVQIISRDTIFVVTTGQSTSVTHFFISVDRGNTWQQVNTTLTIKSFWMINSHEGYATSYNGINKTTDGGLNWVQQQIPGTSAQVTYIKFRDKDNGLAYAESSAIFKTTDGGLHWITATNQVSDPVKSIAFVNADTIIAVCEGGLALRSTDAGDTWQSIMAFSNEAHGLYSVCFVNGAIGFMVGHRGGIYKTTDGGITWTQYAPTYVDMDALHFITDSIGFAATWNNIYKTTDAGSNWIKLSQSTPGVFDRFRYIHFFSKDTGVALSETPVRVYKTYDGGTSWQEINMNIMYNSSILCAFFLDQTIYLSTDGPYGKKVLRSGDAGETWSVQNTSADPYYINLFFTDNKTGYGIYGYYVYKTMDSAKTWNQLLVPVSQLFTSIWFTSATTGYITGDQSYMVKTSDSGHTWHQVYIDPNNANIPGDLKQVRFFNQKTGFVISGNSIYRTITAGNSWKLHGSLAWDLSGIEISPDTSLYVYGIYGSILKRSIKTYEIDSLSADSISGCQARLSANVTAVLSSVDSVWFQYGTSGYTNEVAATPFTVNDTSLKVSAALPGLSQNTNYKSRLKLYYNGNYYYSDSLTFTIATQPTPVVTLIGSTLYSSSSQGNQWYADNVLIPGAAQPSYTPVQSGSYSVKTTIGGCVSEMSSPVAYVITAVTNPLPPGAITIFPNPVTNTLNIQNNQLKKIQIKIVNALGMEVLTLLASMKENMVDMRSFPNGIYLVSITEISTSKSVQKLIIKL